MRVAINPSDSECATTRTLEDHHPNETLVPEDYEEAKRRLRYLAIKIATMSLGNYSQQAQEDVAEFFRLRKLIKGY